MLLIGTAVVFYLGTRKSNDHVDENMFRLADYTAVDKVVMASPEGERTLSYNGAKWMVNDSLVADRNLIDVFFATLTQALPKRPVSVKLQDSIADQLKNSATKVSLYVGNNVTQEFYAGGNRQKTQAFFMNVEDDQPFVMEIPGYRVYVSGIFELDANGWRDKYVFGFNWQNFLHLEAAFPERSKDNFSISMADRMVRVDDMVEQDTARLNNFLDAVSLLKVKQYVDTEMTDSLVRQEPIMNIRVLDLAKREYLLSIYPTEKGSRDQFGLLQGRYPVVFDARSFRDLIKPRDYFAGK